MNFLMKLIGLHGRPEELLDGDLERLLGEEQGPLVVEFYGHG